MDRKSLDLPALIGYLSWPGWIIAILIGDRTSKFTMHHLNQALVLNILSVIAGFAGRLPIVGISAGDRESLAATETAALRSLYS